jgi:hypothetical protein
MGTEGKFQVTERARVAPQQTSRMGIEAPVEGTIRLNDRRDVDR